MNGIFKAALQKSLVGRCKQTDLAKMTGLSVPYINDLCRGRKSGQEEVRRRIARALGFDDYESFLDIGRLELGQAPLRPARTPERVWPEDLADFFRVPFSDHMRLSAGAGGSIPVTDGEDSSPVLLHGPSLGRRNAKNLQAFRVGGDSMEPLIARGGIVLADLKQNEFEHLREGRIYVLCWDLADGECAVKRLKWAERDQLLAIESENGFYDTIYRRPEEVRLIGQVVWSWRGHE
ncbi:MAG: hypothetical protein LBP33_04610 [Candidatus Adiutrix sp.]|jgi:transcriptional regulator with XRE-family HTH domain|nr:hypothetical protein [Candidatus Adiutrix sp.]